MLFSSLTFLCFFLPIVLGVYYLLPHAWRNAFLLLSSLVFYAWGEAILVVVMIATTIINYLGGLIIERGHRKVGLWLALIASFGALGYFKYFNFGASNLYALMQVMGADIADFQFWKIVLPLGISFYTFQTVSYTIDVYRGKVKANHSLVNFATYVTLFPQLVAGPIVRYADIADQLSYRQVTIDKLAQGIERFIYGLFKKMILANYFALIADTVFDNSLSLSTTGALWLGAVAYSLQIYFDFSAYSDMAIGLGRMFGFEFLENFNYPYISRSLKEFWRRWHISLSTWFRDYLYIPLGGNQGGMSRTYLNLLIVFLATGFWHGASWNFIAWGMIHGMALVVERLGFSKVLDRLWRPLTHLYTLVFVILAWVFFRAADLSLAWRYIKGMTGFAPTSTEVLCKPLDLAYFFNIEFLVISAIALVLCLPVFIPVRKKIDDLSASHNFIAYLYRGFVILILIISMISINSSGYNPFIYFRF